jgi:hypothetical protein
VRLVYDQRVLTKASLALLAMTATAMAQPKPATPPPKPAPVKPRPADVPPPAPIKPADPAPAPKPEPKRVRVNLPVIEVLDPSGTMTEPFVRSAIVKVEPELLKCAETAKWQSIAFAWIVTDWRGKVSKLELAVDSASVEKCLSTVLKTVVVQNAQVRATAFVKLHVGVPASDDPMHTLQ